MQLPRFYAGWFLLVFFILFVPSFGVVIWYEVGHITKDGFLDTSFAIAERIGPIAVTLALVLYMGTEGLQMLAEIFLRQREEKGRLKGRTEVVEELVKDMEDAETLEDAIEILRKTREMIDAAQKRQ